MLNTVTAQNIREKVQEAIVLEPKLKLVAEFNNNRFADPEVVLNNTIFDESMSKDSIVEINRPTDEIRYAIAGYAKCSTIESTTPRYRAEGPDTKYEYLRSTVFGGMNEEAFDVYVTYDAARTNVLYANFNTHGGVVRPNLVELYIRTAPEGSWVTVGTHVPNSGGEVILYRQANGTWSNTLTYQDNIPIYGLRLIVRTASLGGRTELVELASKYMTDLSADLTSFSLQYSKEEPSMQQPLGVGQAGSLTLTFDDKSNKFAQGLGEQYNQFAERDAKFMLALGYKVGSQYYYIDQPEYWADSWNFDSGAGTVEVQCTDRSRWIQRATVSDCVFEDAPIPFVVQELLEVSGISGIDFRRASIDGKERLPWVWYQDGESLWDAINTVAKAVNAGFFYNPAGDLVWVSKSKAWETSPVYTFSSDQIGDQVPNLFGFQQQFEEVFNSVKVYYERLDPNVNTFGEPTRQSLWEAESPLSIRSADLHQEINTLDANTTVKIDPEEIEIWPFEGKFQIEGEAFSYEGKKHVLGGISLNADEAADNPNAFNGEFANVVRAIDGTSPDVHVFGTTGALTQFTAFNTAPSSKPPVGASLREGRLNVRVNATRSDYDGVDPGYSYAAWTRGVLEDAYTVYGVELMFPSTGKGRGENLAGLMLHRQSGTSNQAYYFELLTTDYVVNKRNSSVGNLRCYRGTGGGNLGRPTLVEDPTGQGVRGYFVDIEYDTPYKLEVHVGPNLSGQQTFFVYLDGNFITKFTDEIYTSGLWGIFARGDTEVSFECFYAYENDADGRFITQESHLSGWVAQQKLYDRIRGDYAYMGPELAKAGRAGKYRWFFEEFQPVVHERRDFDVEHSVAPAFNFVLFNSNLTGATVRDIHHTPFHTKFVVDNASRRTEVLAGEDTAGGQYLFQLFGQPMARLDAQHITVTNDRSIREHGLNELEYENPWIQTKEQADEQGAFIVDHWSTPVDVATATVQYDPTLELGDLIEVEHEARKIYGRKYFVTGIDIGWDNGFTCSLTLRRNPL